MIDDDVEDVLRRAVVVLRGMAYEHRLHVLLLLCDGDRTPAELAERIPAGSTAVAHHLRYLLDARLIRRRRAGRHISYSLAGEATRRLVDEVLRHAGQ